jgi:hypothetical protein
MVDSQLVTLLRALIDEFSKDTAKVEAAPRSRVVPEQPEVAGKADSSMQLAQAHDVRPLPVQQPLLPQRPSRRVN